MKGTMASQNSGAIDVDAFEETISKHHVKRLSTPTPIVISDDEADTHEIVAKLASPNVIDLVSDDEEADSKVNQASSSKGKMVSRDVSTNLKPLMPVASTSVTKRIGSAATDIKPFVNESGSVFFYQI
jgi:hypothetical protein